jgi:hypothetical protein
MGGGVDECVLWLSFAQQKWTSSLVNQAKIIVGVALAYIFT